MQLRSISKAIKKSNSLNDISGFVGKPDKLNNTKSELNRILKALVLDSEKYNAYKTVTTMKAYLAKKNKLQRILYSEITSFVFECNDSSLTNLANNLDTLMTYVQEHEDELDEDVIKIMIKIYDHMQLAMGQQDNMREIIMNANARASEELKLKFTDEIHKETKEIEKDYITILGIFAAIVLAFVGGITFSTSVLQNIGKVSIYRLVLIVDFLAFTLMNIIHILIRFILTINEKYTEKEIFSIRILNITFLAIAGIDVILWYLK